MESRLAAITDEMCTSLVERRDSDVLLSELTGLAAELGEMEDISETAPATTLPGEPSEPSAGGGYF